MKRTFPLSALLLVFPTLSWGGPTISAGIGNPASQACVNAGGDIYIVREVRGEMGLCQFPGGALIEEWTLARQLRGQKETAVGAFLSRKNQARPRNVNGNPAAIHCADMGGSILLVNNDQGQMGLCQFRDGSIIEAWTLLRGSGDSSNGALVNVLKNNNN